MWVPESKGSFTVKSTYLIANSVPNVLEATHVNWKKLWNLKALERLKMLLWRLCYDILLTKENLSERFIITESSCNLCKNAFESACHIFLFYPVTKALWFALCWGFKSKVVSTSSTKDIVNLVLNLLEALCQTWGHWKVSLTMALILDEIWHLKSAELFMGSNSNLATSILSI
nr:putative ribonuclease h protein [Quercus suber]